MSENITEHGPKKKAFLAAFRETGNVRVACETAGVGRSSHYRWLEADAEYRDDFALVKEDAIDILEAEAYRRAVEGSRRYKFHKDGSPVRHPEICECGHERIQHTAGEGTDELPCADPDCTTCRDFLGAPYYETAYSDVLLIFTLKGLLPDKYRERLPTAIAAAFHALKLWVMLRLGDGWMRRMRDVIRGDHPCSNRVETVTLVP